MFPGVSVGEPYLSRLTATLRGGELVGLLAKPVHQVFESAGAPLVCRLRSHAVPHLFCPTLTIGVAPRYLQCRPQHSVALNTVSRFRQCPASDSVDRLIPQYELFDVASVTETVASAPRRPPPYSDLMELLAWAIAGAAAITAALLALRLRASAKRIEKLENQLDRDTEAERALAASDERARIAREMHDVVAHTLSVVVAQADGGRFAGAQNPTLATHALATIAEVGRSALSEMRSLLGVLRDSDSDAALGPQPSLADIPTLVASMRDGGLAVSFVTTGTPRTMPIGAGLAVYRIVQEALTNVLKHAGPSVTAFVQLQWEADAVTATVSDDGRGAAALRDGKGTGLAGMRERTAVFNGTLDVGSKAGGGYLVRARLPFRATFRTGADAGAGSTTEATGFPPEPSEQEATPQASGDRASAAEKEDQ